jgi:uncharacterized protein
VNPLYIGTAQRRIFGIHDPAAPTGGRPRAAVLCYPWGTEYIYAHRSMRQLALKLSASGYHTLRFDYFGTGDSSGDASDIDLTGWQSDTESAIEALKDIAGTTKVALIGLRVGANIAASVASRSPTEVEALVLWDPIVTGAQVGAADEPVSRKLGDFGAIDTEAVFDALPPRSLILVTERLEAHEVLVRRDAQSGSGTSRIEFVTAPCPWVESATTTGALPMPVIRRIEAWLQ